MSFSSLGPSERLQTFVSKQECIWGLHLALFTPLDGQSVSWSEDILFRSALLSLLLFPEPISCFTKKKANNKHQLSIINNYSLTASTWHNQRARTVQNRSSHLPKKRTQKNLAPRPDSFRLTLRHHITHNKPHSSNIENKTRTPWQSG